MTRRPLILIAAILTSLVLAPTAFAASMNVEGTGRATFTARGEASTFSSLVSSPGRVKLVAGDAASFRPACIRRVRRKPCVRFNTKTGWWVVLRPVKFAYDGADFKLLVASRKSFQLGLNGIGLVILDGAGNYTMDGVTTPYVTNPGDPPIRIKLGRTRA